MFGLMYGGQKLDELATIAQADHVKVGAAG
jgi:hypothetical protein